MSYSLRGDLSAVINHRESTLGPGWAWDYQYDKLGQLVSASSLGRGSITYTYDSLQNVLSKSSTIAHTKLISGYFQYDEDNQKPNQLLHVSGITLDYNDAGEVVDYDRTQMRYDANGLMSLLSEPDGTNIYFHYDHDDIKRLVIREDMDGQKEFQIVPFSGYRLTDLGRQLDIRAERKLGTLFQERKPKPSLRELEEVIAQDIGSDIENYQWDDEAVVDMASRYWLETPSDNESTYWTFFHHGHGRSAVLGSTEEGAIRFRSEYFPYGQKANQKGQSQELGYAGYAHSRLVDSPVFVVGKRVYLPRVMRWGSPDRYFMSDLRQITKNVLELNGYSYSRNSPLLFYDPNGEVSGGRFRMVQKMSWLELLPQFLQVSL